MWPVKGIKKSGSCCCWSTTQMRVPSEVIPIEAVAALATETASAAPAAAGRQPQQAATKRLPKQAAGRRQQQKNSKCG